MTVDPLSDVMKLLKLKYLKTGAADVGGPMSLRLSQHEGLFCYAVLRGGCWIVFDQESPIRLAAGDCAVLPSGRPFTVTSNPGLEPVDAAAFFASRRNGGVMTYGGGGDCFLYAGHFAFERQDGGLLLDVLPSLVLVRDEGARATLRWSLDRIMTELREPRSGGDLIVEHLAHFVLVEALRLHLGDGSGERVGWLPALADRRLRTAISAVHASPAGPWSVQSLAAIAGMSRTAFAVEFRRRVGVAPMAYVTGWRMLLAASALRCANTRVSEVGFSIGYTSEAAFSTAFRKVMGSSPRRYAQSSIKAAV